MLFGRSVFGPFVYLLLMEGLVIASEENRTPDSSLGNRREGARSADELAIAQRERYRWSYLSVLPEWKTNFEA